MVNEIKERLKLVAQEIGCSTLDLVLSAGAGMVMHGARDHFDDLDLDIEMSKFKALKELDKYPHKDLPNGMELLSIFPWADVHGQLRVADTVVIDGVRVFTVRELIQQKKTLLNLPGRSEKKIRQDIADIAALERLLKEEA